MSLSKEEQFLNIIKSYRDKGLLTRRDGLLVLDSFINTTLLKSNQAFIATYGLWGSEVSIRLHLKEDLTCGEVWFLGRRNPRNPGTMKEQCSLKQLTDFCYNKVMNSYRLRVKAWHNLEIETRLGAIRTEMQDTLIREKLLEIGYDE